MCILYVYMYTKHVAHVCKLCHHCLHGDTAIMLHHSREMQLWMLHHYEPHVAVDAAQLQIAQQLKTEKRVARSCSCGIAYLCCN